MQSLKNSVIALLSLGAATFGLGYGFVVERRRARDLRKQNETLANQIELLKVTKANTEALLDTVGLVVKKTLSTLKPALSGRDVSPYH